MYWLGVWAGYVFKAQLQKEFLLAAQGSWQTFGLPR
jgi:hypothetical protein